MALPQPHPNAGVPTPVPRLTLVHSVEEIEEAERVAHARDHELWPILVKGMAIGALIGAILGAVLITTAVTVFDSFHPWIIGAGAMSVVVFGAYFGGFVWLATRCMHLFDD